MIAIATTPVAYGYTRYSTPSQAESALIQSYSERCERYWKYRLEPQGVTWGGMVIDAAVSSRKHFPIRQAATELLRRMRKGDHIIFPSIDRPWRSTKDMLQTVELFKNRKYHFHIEPYNLDTTSHTSELILTIMAAIAENERKTIAARTTEALQQKRENGMRTTRFAPYGYVWNGSKKTQSLDPDMRPSGCHSAGVEFSRFHMLGVQLYFLCSHRDIRFNNHIKSKTGNCAKWIKQQFTGFKRPPEVMRNSMQAWAEIVLNRHLGGLQAMEFPYYRKGWLPGQPIPASPEGMMRCIGCMADYPLEQFDGNVLCKSCEMFLTNLEHTNTYTAKWLAEDVARRKKERSARRKARRAAEEKALKDAYKNAP
jgi:putative DNA-invertase from lambdoid prophage Rac